MNKSCGTFEHSETIGSGGCIINRSVNGFACRLGCEVREYKSRLSGYVLKLSLKVGIVLERHEDIVSLSKMV